MKTKKTTCKDEAQELINYSLKLLSIQYNSEGVVMKRSECLPKARMIARALILFSTYQGDFDWKQVDREIDMCF